MRVEQLYFGVELGELGEIDSTVFVNPVVDERAALGSGCNDGKEGEVID